MTTEDFRDATVVLIGHGSTVNADSAAAVRRHAEELRRRRLFEDVREAFCKQEPLLASVPEVKSRRVFFVPMFISEGYFSEQAVPSALGFRAEGQEQFERVKRVTGQRQFYCHPIGTHESVTGVLLARAKGVLGQFPFPRAPRLDEVTLFVAGHGTEQDANSRISVERQVRLLAQTGVFAAVHAVFIEEEPRIGSCYDMAETGCIVVVPFFMSDGLHVEEDIPVLLGEPEAVVQRRLEAGKPTWRNPTERRGKLVWCAGSIGTEPLICEVIIERISEAAKWG